MDNIYLFFYIFIYFRLKKELCLWYIINTYCIKKKKKELAGQSGECL
jgi:hypothetical protein